jgi:mono/diheme cytochrome c family protein
MNFTRVFALPMLGALLSGTAHAQQPAAALSQGEYLARAGDCVACHSVPGGKAFAGGLKVGTPLGVLYSTNITPDPDTGIGRYSFKDFDRAVRFGVARDGHHLYPAMPYPSYAKTSDADMQSLYTFFMKEVPPVRQANVPNEIPRYLSWRWPLVIWNMLFTAKPSFIPNPAHAAQWNRGAYLVEGLGHCGACHTPRGLLWQEKALDDGSATYLSGANLDAWFASDLRGDVRTGLGSWSQADIATFLKTGHNERASAFGSMLDTVNNSTPYLSEEDANAVAAFLKSLPATAHQATYVYDDATSRALLYGKAQGVGGTIYLGYCVSCHGTGGKGQAPYMPPLAGSPAVLDADPSSLINLVLNGANPLIVKGAPDAYRMPQFRIQLTDTEIAGVLSFVRAAWGNGAAPVTADQVKTLRPVTDPSSDRVIVLKMR